MKIDLPPAHLESLRRLLTQYAPHLEIWAYGSRVSGAHHAGSNLDLVVRSPDERPIARAQFHALKDALEESDLPVLIDLFDWGTLPEAFRCQIQRAHVPLQSAQTAASAVSSTRYT